MCRDKETRTYSNGTIQLIDVVLEELRECWFNIIAPLNRKEIYISCPFVSLNSTTSYLKVSHSSKKVSKIDCLVYLNN